MWAFPYETEGEASFKTTVITILVVIVSILLVGMIVLQAHGVNIVRFDFLGSG